jgi:CheY-like chemotaxis protein
VIRLPLAARASADVPAAADTASSMLRAHRVLVVDDNRDSAGRLGMLLTLLGVDVQVTFSGQEALDAAATVVLLDIGMPGMDGHEVARRIRRDPAFKNVTLIAVTGWGQEEDRRRSALRGSTTTSLSLPTSTPCERSSPRSTSPRRAQARGSADDRARVTGHNPLGPLADRAFRLRGGNWCNPYKDCRVIPC